VRLASEGLVCAPGGWRIRVAWAKGFGRLSGMDSKGSGGEPAPAKKVSSVGFGIAMGIAMGTAFGAALHNVGTGLALGISFGVIFGAALDKKQRKSG